MGILSSTFHEYINASYLSNLVSESAWIHDDSFTTLPDLGGDKDSPDFFDAHSSISSLTTANVDLDIPYFFDSFVSASSLHQNNIDTDYFDCLPSHNDPSLFYDWMDLDDLSSNTYLDCSWDLDTVSSVHNLPSPKAYHTLLRGGVSNYFDDNSSYGEPSIFLL